jgi:hypothetical protein
VAEPVIGGALVGIGKHGIGLGRFLELLLRIRVAGVAVRMVPERELAVRALDLLISCAAPDAQDLVVIALAHALATLTSAGLRSRSPIV